jgi:hypothetical protein
LANKFKAVQHKKSTRQPIRFNGVGDAVARLLRFGAAQAGNNVYIEKRVGLKVIGAADYINNMAGDNPLATRAVFGKMPS